ncbi:MAG TPA: tetratricopeptide repeat protein, partial [Ktedonobacterales bacterium]|nr:tetratricopeptide repeat protein [Ktedonobacterales bacterium]
ERAIELAPNYGSAWLNRGVALSRLKRHEEALAAYDQALTFEPMNPLVWNNKASTLCKDCKRYDEALSVCDEALAHGVSIAGIWAIKGDALHALGRDSEARAAFETVLTFPTDDFLSWASTGSALDGLGRFDDALAAFETALTFHTDSADTWREKAEVLRALGREDEARDAEQQADELDR